MLEMEKYFSATQARQAASFPQILFTKKVSSPQIKSATSSSDSWR